MDSTRISDQALTELITGTSPVEFDFLAAKILLTKLRHLARFDSSPTTLAKSVTELRNLFNRFQQNAAVQSDLQKLTSSSGSPGSAEVLFSPEEVAAKIAQGQILVLAGDHALLRQIPPGNWIGGTIPYFMATRGGVFTKEKLFVTELPSYATSISIRTYTQDTISSVYKDAPENGLSIIIIPGSSQIHFSFALDAPSYDLFALRPLMGWISGCDVADIGKVAPEVVSGKNRLPQRNAAVVMHLGLPADRQATINIVNIFRQGSGDSITFVEDGFSAVDAQINGVRREFAEYLQEKKINTKLPLVANYSGALINTSFQAIDQAQKKVSFYAPVFRGTEYRVAAPIGDYVSAFNSNVPRTAAQRAAFSCNCILNYLYSELEGKRTGSLMGPITFGEIAYQLVNQTLAFATIQSTKEH
ncbi:MAG TPA: hypothetical protein VMV03_00525 [Spirochaetia bacterium]|nr:hypothetical protein [Spirochaetia bacterium]